MPKSADAFRTISEVAEWLDTPAHVLRFWESKFSQIKPVKRAGGRRYYRPADMELLGGIKRLLHEEGMTIKGVQKLLRDRGITHVAAMSHPLDDLAVALDEPATEAEVVPLQPRGTPRGGPGPMTPPDGSEAGAAARGAADPAEDDRIVAGHGTPAPPEQPAEDAQAEPAEENLFLDTPADAPSPPEEDAGPAAAPVADPDPALAVIPDDPEDDDFVPEPGLLALLAARETPIPAEIGAEALALARRLAPRA